MSNTGQPPTTENAALSRSPSDSGTPGVIVVVNSDAATAMGAFREKALSEADAWEANAEIGSD